MLRHEVFVYGTLRRGEGNHALLAGAEFLGFSRTEAQFTLYDLGAYPGVVPGGLDVVYGERYRVDDATLDALDRLEEHPDYYRRETIVLHDGERAWIYLLPAREVAGARRIAGGDWLRREALAG
ncbi:MAG: hypothetical protein RL562_2357 [Planctomycetota bacterium]